MEKEGVVICIHDFIARLFFSLKRDFILFFLFSHLFGKKRLFPFVFRKLSKAFFFCFFSIQMTYFLTEESVLIRTIQRN